jgi:hypothetical protein
VKKFAVKLLVFLVVFFTVGHQSTTPGQSPGVLSDNRQPGLVGGFEVIPSQQTAWNQYLRLQSVPETVTADGIRADPGFQGE